MCKWGLGLLECFPREELCAEARQSYRPGSPEILGAGGTASLQARTSPCDGSLLMTARVLPEVELSRMQFDEN